MSLSQEDLETFWHSSAPGRLTPWQQAFALGLAEASKEIHGGHVAVGWITKKLRKTDSTGQKYTNKAPGHGAVSDFFSKVKSDPRWFPGKQSGAKRGPKPVLTAAKRARIASSAMSQKSEGDEPSVDVTIFRCHYFGEQFDDLVRLLLGDQERKYVGVFFLLWQV